MSTMAISYVTVSSKRISFPETLYVDLPIRFIIQSFTEGLNALPISFSVEWVGSFVYSMGNTGQAQNSMWNKHYTTWTAQEPASSVLYQKMVNGQEQQHF